MPGNPTIDNLNPIFYQQLLGLVAASGGGITLQGGSGWRSFQQQQKLHNDYIHHVPGQARAAKPGTSEHEFGLAFDLVYVKPGAEQWAHDNAARFGLRFPMSDEGWHVQPINLAALKSGTPTGIVGPTDQGFVQLNPAQARDQAKALYGYLGWFVDHPEVGPIIINAAMNGWDMAHLQGALVNTKWWKQTSESARQWDALLASDGAQAAARISETSLSLKLEAAQLGFPVDQNRMYRIAVDANRLGWNPEETKLALLAELKYNPAQASRGTVGATMRQVRQTASDHMVPINDRQAFEWARRIAAGTADAGAVDAQMKKLATARFPYLAKSINAGVTPGQFFAPYRNLIGQILGRSPEQVDLMDEKWAPVVAVGSGDHLRPMTFGEVARYARADPSWGGTEDAARVMDDYNSTFANLFGT